VSQRGGSGLPRSALAAVLCSAAVACGPSGPAGTVSTPPPSPADRAAYVAFRAGHPSLPEPNYVPFMPNRFAGEGGRDDLLVFCRWSEGQLPLSVAIDAPEIPPSLENEFDPKPPELYVRAVERALAAWEEALDGVLRFHRAGPGETPTLRVRLRGEVAPTPEPDIAVLGTTSLGGACRAQGWEEEGARVRVGYGVSEVRVYVADEFGLLTEEQVHRVALHELGHALGMRGHSPIPADVMYEVVRDVALPAVLTPEDVQSFRALYAVPNGTVYGRVAPRGPLARPAVAPGPPRLVAEPRVDARHGFSLRPPEGWMVVDSPHGLIAIDGVTWDYDASLQVIAQAYPSADAYLARHGAVHIGPGSLVARRELVLAGRRAVQLVVEGRIGPMSEEITVVEASPERVLVVIADCPVELHDAYAPWFEAVLRSLAVQAPNGGA